MGRSQFGSFKTMPQHPLPQSWRRRREVGSPARNVRNVFQADVMPVDVQMKFRQLEFVRGQWPARQDVNPPQLIPQIDPVGWWPGEIPVAWWREFDDLPRRRGHGRIRQTILPEARNRNGGKPA